MHWKPEGFTNIRKESGNRPILVYVLFGQPYKHAVDTYAVDSIQIIRELWDLMVAFWNK